MASVSVTWRRSWAKAMPVMSSSDGWRRRGRGRRRLASMAAVNCWRVRVPGTAKISGRGVMTSRTTLSPNSTTERTSSRSDSSRMPSSSPASSRASMASDGCLGLGGVFGLGEGGDREQQAEQQGDRQDEVEERRERGGGGGPEAAGAGEEELRDEAVEKKERRGRVSAAERATWRPARGDGRRVGVEAEAEEQREGGERELAEDEAERATDSRPRRRRGSTELLPGIDVVLVLAGEELAHLGVDAVDVGGER